MSEDEPKHNGFLIRGSTGQLWFLRDDFEAPQPVEASAIHEIVNNFAPIDQQDQMGLFFDLPKQVIEELESANFGPLFWCHTIVTAARLKR